VRKGVGEWPIECCCRRQEELREATLVFDVAVVAGVRGAGDAVSVVAVVVVVTAAVVVAAAAEAFAGLGEAEVGVVEVVIGGKGDHVAGVTSSPHDDMGPPRGHVGRVLPELDTFL